MTLIEPLSSQASKDLVIDVSHGILLDKGNHIDINLNKEINQEDIEN